MHITIYICNCAPDLMAYVDIGTSERRKQTSISLLLDKLNEIIYNKMVTKCVRQLYRSHINNCPVNYRLVKICVHFTLNLHPGSSEVEFHYLYRLISR